MNNRRQCQNLGILSLGLLLLCLPQQAWASPFSPGNHADTIYTEGEFVEFNETVATSPLLVNPGQSVPQRPLTLGRKNASAHTGLSTDLTTGGILQSWALPLGAGFGVTELLEVGLDSNFVFIPIRGNSLFSETRIYGRYLLMRELLALELGVTLPNGITTAFDMQAPFRYRIAPIELYGQGSLYYGLSSGAAATGTGISVDNYHSFAVGLSVTALMGIPNMQKLFAFVDLGGTFISGDFGGTRNNLMVIPVGLGAGYKLTDDMLIKAGLTFPNMLNEKLSTTGGTEWGGLTERLFQVVVVQAFDLSGSVTQEVQDVGEALTSEVEEASQEMGTTE